MPRAYAELTQLALNLVDADRTVQWGIGDYAREALEDLGVPIEHIASDWGFAKSTIRKMVKVVKKFPRADQRNPELSFSHYVIAAGTSDAAYWVAWAADTQASTRDLREAVNVAKARDPIEEKTRQAEAAIQRVRRIWQEADEALRDHMRGPLQAFLQAELT